MKWYSLFEWDDTNEMNAYDLNFVPVVLCGFCGAICKVCVFDVCVTSGQTPNETKNTYQYNRIIYVCIRYSKIRSTSIRVYKVRIYTVYWIYSMCACLFSTKIKMCARQRKSEEEEERASERSKKLQRSTLIHTWQTFVSVYYFKMWNFILISDVQQRQ